MLSQLKAYSFRLVSESQEVFHQPSKKWPGSWTTHPNVLGMTCWRRKSTRACFGAPRTAIISPQGTVVECFGKAISALVKSLMESSKHPIYELKNLPVLAVGLWHERVAGSPFFTLTMKPLAVPSYTEWVPQRNPNFLWGDSWHWNMTSNYWPLAWPCPHS